jgi:hypothetical protein
MYDALHTIIHLSDFRAGDEVWLHSDTRTTEKGMRPGQSHCRLVDGLLA